MLPSGCGMPAMPIKLSVLMSASVAFTSADTRASSATFTFSMAPSRVLSESMAPSTFSIWPRMRAGCCARAAVAARLNAMATAASARRVTFMFDIISSQTVAGVVAPGLQEDNPSPRLSFRLIPPGAFGRQLHFFLRVHAGGGRRCAQIGYHQRAQFRGDFRAYAEPAFEAPYRLVQQHAEPVGGAQPALARHHQYPGHRRRRAAGDPHD